MVTLLPPPGDADRGHPGAGPESGATPGAGPQRSHGGSRPRVELPSVDEVLAKLLQLNGLVALGVVSTAQAAVIQRNLRTVLDALMKRAQGGGPSIGQESLADLARRDPHLLNLLEPFLTEEQVAWILGATTQDSHDPA